ncbi:hypothetical protein SDC9_07424 [bioreactor metagenome]|uniref:Phage-like element PBSX protein XkdF domain-containing protein n=1 Tax=bioreactor metagenome TaxID=1076179 RepID=A0A644T4I5_9ZZZZ|nr:XkdF-like putative serine protease domain-containing protein [Methanobrevibacter sp.]MEA4956880.1 XkdF-like putative serine protease domain-containing protein [Methanobrevibacter sp.]
MMNTEQKEQGEWYKACVLVNGDSDPEAFKDCRDQLYTEREIKQIATTEANKTNFDIYHNKKIVEGGSVIFNYISTTPETLGGVTVPSGSFMKILHVDNDDINQKIKNGKINGVSPTLRANKESEECICNQRLPIGEILYEDVPNKECFEQVFLSFVESPCNRIPLEHYDSYESYLDNMKHVDDTMTENKKLDEIVEAVKAGIGLAKDSHVENADPSPAEQPPAEDNKTPSLDEIKQAVNEIVQPLQERMDELQSQIDELKPVENSEEETEEEVDNEETVENEEVENEETSEVNNNDPVAELKTHLEKLGIEIPSEVNNQEPIIRTDLGKDTPNSEVNNENQTPTDSYGRKATDYREIV